MRFFCAGGLWKAARALMLARIVQPEGNLTGGSLRDAANPFSTARGSSFLAWRRLLCLGLPFLLLGGREGWASGPRRCRLRTWAPGYQA